MFSKVLVANRGEIACRVIQTLRRLKIASVAVYHAADRVAPHVKLADEAVLLRADVPTAAYLDQEQILAVCAQHGVDAIHPGYGFLSENANFVEKALAAGISFIGPDPLSMRLMGDKIRARTFAVEQGVPVAPSAIQHGSLQEFIAAAAKVGFPLLIKAAAGGGGKGMRIVRTGAELEEGARAAAAEAQRYFSDGRVYAERFIERPRHIEVQVFGDGNGAAVHLHERECSVQRRYQKIIEESPAPNLSKQLKEAICAAALKLVRAARYKNAGTVEFMLAPQGEFYFLEMNTRLQVEHPVTEMTLGLDLVEQQLRIAAGEGLSLQQDQLQQRGHAIEVRICAEEPEHDFRPAVGRIGLLRIPQAAGLRLDSGIVAGQSVTPAFDSMLAKLIAHGSSRADAITRLGNALQHSTLLGVATNIDYLGRILRNDEFRAGRLHTGFLAEQAPQLTPPAATDEQMTVAALAAAFNDPTLRRTFFDAPEPQASMGHWRN
jgi:propionyl-CoA carboxylase alpha chain/3-methylcrotonyl-CoA carboxylase alpha subunit/acetyl-CoA/propionyl-CoA carboxylase biotin carboxyl carrier protein